MAKKDKKSKKDKKEKKAKQSTAAVAPAPQQQMVNPFMMMNPFMFGQNAAAPQTAAAVAPETKSSSSSSSADDSEEEKTLHRGATVMLKLPGVRLQQILEAIDQSLDACITAAMGKEDMCRIIWMTTRIKPTTRTALLGKSSSRLLRFG